MIRVYSSNNMKLRHSTICTLYSSTKFEALIRTKCIRRNMRSTCQWSCVLQFTWRRAVCCGLHRPMSQVIPCLGLNLYNFVFIYIPDINLCYFTLLIKREIKSIGISELPWRNPLETNNISTHILIKRHARDSRKQVPRIFVYSLSLPFTSFTR